MKIVITGSHFTPAQAVIEKLKEESDVNLLYIGRKYTREGDKSLSFESQVLPKLGVKFIPITTGRLQRTFTLYTIPSLFKIPVGFVQSFYFLLRHKPDVVLSFGGYVSVPVVISAWLLSIPIIIHEQTLVSGLANTISSYFADKIAVSFENHEFLGGKVVLTGNPLRKEVIYADNKLIDTDIKKIIDFSKHEHLPLILITGGNQGSHIINESFGEILNELTKEACIIHQTGDSKFQDFERLTEKRQNLKNSERYLVKKTIDGGNMGEIFRNVDLVISRAGMNTLTELAYFSVPTLIIPIPYLYKDEQNKNAQFFEKLGLAKVLLQKDLTPERLLADISEMVKNIGNLKIKAKEAQKVVIPDAASRLALETLLLGKRS